MMTLLAWAMIATFMALIITKKLSPFTALIVVPFLFALVGSFFGLYAEQAAKVYKIADPTLWHQIRVLGEFTVEGVKKTSTTGIMLLFAIMYFSIMLNTGMFDPITRRMIQFAKGDPKRILIATGIVAAAVSLNGDGTTTTLIVCTAFLPLYKKMNMKLMNLAVITVLMNTIMNLLPWGGPTARVISVLPSLNGKDAEILRALAPGMVVAFLYMMGVCYVLGRRESARIGVRTFTQAELNELTASASPEEEALKRPKLFWFNLILTIALVAMLMAGTFPSVFLFLAGTVVALMVNYPKQKDQKARIQDNAGDALQVVILVFAAGIFSGLFTSTGMSTALANSLVAIIPQSLGRAWGLVVAVLSAPGTFFLSNDAFYYGVLPVFAETGKLYGFSEMSLGVASLLGQAFHLLSPLVAFIYLLINLTEVEMGAWQKEAGKWAIGIFISFVGVAAITGIVPLII
ncbi:CitMHS family transporter [Parasphaerochaeta coccoides]|uniref:Citrate/H+ symporter, CitMHS family n=1 Tax=Parasphaerochaeta coccoides (strain ATCC BAA-1237 / DSM 17374 / SPN1) TaxID=760011 RepID=F4GLB3_PARC1|nr:citrate:proton symporter [Parasphaerochaeta coccoides]AEC02945.1 citrate/H+ symporter, CitMHS family [Parasphaerochaeta coccoides DSM 17374]